MKKIFSILMAAFAMTAMVACGDTTEGTGNGGGNNNGDGNGTEQTTRLSGAKYYKYRDFAGDVSEHTVVFGQGNEVEYHVDGTGLKAATIMLHRVTRPGVARTPIAKAAKETPGMPRAS